MALVDPKVVHFSEETQRVVNWLPQWHAGRRLRTSNWTKIINSLAGEHLGDLRREQDRAFRNLYLQTAHTDEPDLIRRATVLANIDLNPRLNNINRLKNGGFALRSRIDKVADYWSHSGNIETTSSSLFGTRAVRLLPNQNESSSISQTISQTDSWGVGDKRTFSCWYKIPSWDGGTIPSTSHGLLVTVTYHDNTTELFRAAFAEHTSNQWRRNTLTVDPAKSVANYEVKIETSRSIVFNITAPVDIDGVQAQDGAAASPWEPNILDKPFWFVANRIFGVQIEADTDVFLTDSLRDFFYHAIPTRVSLTDTRTKTSSANRGGGVDVLVDFDRKRWTALWKADTTNNKILLEGLDPKDRYIEVDLSFFTGTDTGPKYEEGVSGLDYLCAAKFRNWLYVVHEMPDINGTTKTVLSVCNPRLPYPRPEYMETLYSIELPVDSGVDYHSIEFRYEDTQHLYLASSTQEFVLQLHYDYAMIDEQALDLFLREHYTNLAVVK